MNAKRWFAVADGVLQGVDGERGGALRGQAPADDAPREAIHDHSEVTPSASDLEVSDVAVPEKIGGSDIKVADAVGHAGEEFEDGHAAAKQAIAMALQAGQTHQASDAATADADTAVAQLASHAGAAVEASGVFVGLADVLNQLSVMDAAGAGGSALPGIKARTRDLELRAHQRDREGLAVCFDEAEDVSLRSETNRMAFFSRSCSCCSFLNWRSTSRRR